MEMTLKIGDHMLVVTPVMLEPDSDEHEADDASAAHASERWPAQPGMQQCCDGYVRLGQKCGRCGYFPELMP